MPSILNEVSEWLDRAEQAREVAGQLTDPGARKAVLELAESFDRLARAAATPAVLRRRELAAKDWENRMISPMRSLAKHQVRVDRWKRMGHHKGFLTPEERSRITELQDLLIECYVERKKAVADGQEERVKSVEAEIDSLLREKEEIEKWAVLGSA
jgi:hypothetical protein